MDPKNDIGDNTRQQSRLQHPARVSLAPHQEEAIRSAEKAIAGGYREIVVSMVQGSGKVLTSAALVDRLVNLGIARHVLYLVSRRDLVDRVANLFKDSASASLNSSTDLRKGLKGTTHTGSPNVTISTIQRLTREVRDDAAEHESTERDGYTPRFDLVVTDDIDALLDSQSESTWRHAVNQISAPVVNFTGNDAKASQGLIPVVFRYTIASALNDRILIDYNAVNFRSAKTRRDSTNSSALVKNRSRAAIAYSPEVFQEAKRLAAILSDRGVDVVPFSASDGALLRKNLLTEISAEDIFIGLLSPSSIDAFWAEDRFLVELDRRGVEVVPAVVRPCPLPFSLSDRPVVDLTDDPNKILDVLDISRRVKLDSLSPARFESLIGELLQRLNFDLSPTKHGFPYAYRGLYRDPLGFADPVSYLIQVKFRHTGVRDLHAFAGIVESDRQAWRGLLATNSQLTSAASNELARINSEASVLHVIDSLKIKSYLLAHQSLIREYFVIGTGRR